MSRFQAKKFRIVLSVFASLVLIIIVGGFALSQGYLIHFLLNEQTISRDEFYHFYEEALQGKPVHIACAQDEPTLGWLYIYESHCFTTDAAADTYMKEHFGSS